MVGSCKSHAHSKRKAFTLIELVVAMAISTVLMAGIASALIIASRALPDASDPLTQTLEGSFVVSRIATDLYSAENFTERTPTAVTFTVADRTGDKISDTLRYAWSGIIGAPLTRQFNGGPVSIIHQAIGDFQLEYLLDPVTTSAGGGTTITIDYLTSAKIHLDGVGGVSTRTQTQTQILNTPQVAGP